VEQQESDDVDADKVISQSPNGGEEASTDDEIKLIVSAGKSSESVPSVVGYTSDQASTLLTQNGFEVKYAYDYSDTVEENKVIRQSPQGNSSASKGDTVTITVSRGEEVKEVTMISVVGMTVQEAAQALEDIGLKYSETKASSDTYEKGEVIAQDYAKGTKVKTGTVVGLTISSGPDVSNTTYSGSATLEDILDADVDSGRLQVYKSGESSPFIDVTVTHDNFPFPINVSNTSATSVKVSIYLDGAKKTTMTIPVSAD
jgi:serine/threonine-protein kinase